LFRLARTAELAGGRIQQGVDPATDIAVSFDCLGEDANAIYLTISPSYP
jgi:hypothetical protein